MKLDDYLKRNGLTSPDFARVSGIHSKQTIHNYRHGIRFPSPDNLRRIREATKGAVTAEDFVDQHIVAPPAPGVSRKATGVPVTAASERELLAVFRSTDDQGRDMILRLARSLDRHVPAQREAAE